MSAKPAFEPALRAYAARERRALDDHPTPEILVAYRAGDLAGEEEENLRDHLALCAECAEMLLDLVEFEEFRPPAETPGVTDAEIEAAWNRVQPRLGVGGEERLATVVALSERLVEPRTSRKGSEYESMVWAPRLRRAYALAAALFLCVFGLSFWGASLEKKVRKLSQPHINLTLVDAFSENDGQRGSSPESATPLLGEYFHLIVHPFQLPEAPQYGVEIRRVGSAGPLTLKTSGLQPLPEGIFSLEIDSKTVSPGPYRVDLFAVTSGKWRKFDSLLFRVGPVSR